MKSIPFLGLLLLGATGLCQKVISRKKFFESDSFLTATLRTDYLKLESTKKQPEYIPASITFHNLSADGPLTENIQVKNRGYFRRLTCSFASLYLNFKDSTGKSRMQNFKEAKVTLPCVWGTDDEQWLLREYLVYRIYQLFTDKSLRPRLVQFTFEDDAKSFKPYKQYGFIMEDVDDMAKRNDFVEAPNPKYMTDQTNREHTTMVALFEYMISNYDWNVPAKHNVKFIVPKDSLGAKPYLVPYDFDFSGAVNSLNADPPANLPIKKVTDRLYLGFPRTMEELKKSLALFQEREEAIYKTIEDFPLLRRPGKDEMKAFIKSFFELIKDDANIKKIFIYGARKK